MSSILPPVTIIGAGLSGLTLGLCLKHKGIPAIIYDRAAASPRHNYGILLHRATYKPLLNILHMDEATFRAKAAIDSQHGGTDSLQNTKMSEAKESFRCHRGRLESILGHGLDIVWDKELKDVQPSPRAKEVTAVFDDGNHVSTKCLIGCDGPHSMTRNSLVPGLKPQILPFVVFNGKRYISLDEYHDKISRYIRESGSIRRLEGDILLEISVNDTTESQVSLSYTYSRPARDGNDHLHRPDRPTTGATDIPEAFFTEIVSLAGLPPPFDSVFDIEKVRKDRLLHWLMRIVPLDVHELARLADFGVALMGDAAHAVPILGGEGANAAIQDAIALAEHLTSRDTLDLKSFLAARAEVWKKLGDDSKERLESMHMSSSSRL